MRTPNKTLICRFSLCIEALKKKEKKKTKKEEEMAFCTSLYMGMFHDRHYR
jgi:hypothetical protein